MSQAVDLTPSLEDYLETIYQLVRDSKLARVRDIAKARGVQPGSVSPAMKRLSGMGLIRYVQREFIDLTPEGLEQAQRVYARHQVLTRLFCDVLGLDDLEAEQNACAMEHSISENAMDRLVRFFEFIDVCPGGKNVLEAFQQCTVVNQDSAIAACSCGSTIVKQEDQVRRVSELSAGDRGKVTHVLGKGAIRQRLLDMGILPNVEIEVERVAPAGDPLWIKLQGFQLSLRRAEAEAVIVVVCD